MTDGSDLLSNKWLMAVERKFEEPQDVDTVGKPMLLTTTGLERADYLSIQHIELAVENLLSLQREEQSKVFSAISPDSDEHLKALVCLALKVKTRKY